MIPLSQHLTAHRPILGGILWHCSCGATGVEDGPTHPQHQVSTWEEACVVRTVEELDALPDFALLHVVGWSTAVQKFYGRWYPTGGTGAVDERRITTGRPTLTWSPSWDRAQQPDVKQEAH